MSILDSGPYTVKVYPEIDTWDSRGNPLKGPADVPVIITGCTITPIASTRDRDGDVHNDVQLHARDAPLGPWSRVRWNEKDFFVIDGPHRFAPSDAITHVSAVLREER